MSLLLKLHIRSCRNFTLTLPSNLQAFDLTLAPHLSPSQSYLCFKLWLKYQLPPKLSPPSPLALPGGAGHVLVEAAGGRGLGNEGEVRWAGQGPISYKPLCGYLEQGQPRRGMELNF